MIPSRDNCEAGARALRSVEPPPPAPWSFSPDEGALQGPLELRSFADHGLRLELLPGQTALLARGGSPRATWLAGAHELRIGDGPGAIPPDGRLFMIATNVPLRCRWGTIVPLRMPAAPPPAVGSPGGDAPPRGTCEFVVSSPVRFYRTFLRNAETAGEAFVRRLLGMLAQSLLEERCAAEPAAARDARAWLAGLTRDDLADGWAPLGVSLVAFACEASEGTRAAAPTRPAGHPVAARV